jgi:hypothetical protein
MMNQQPDKLFRERLAGLNRPAPSSAWSRVEANLDKKKSKGLWLKIAASLLILFVASFVIWNIWSSENENDLTSQRNQAKPEEAPLKQETRVHVQNKEKIEETQERPAIADSKSVKEVRKDYRKKPNTITESKPVIKEDNHQLLQQQIPIADIAPVELKLPENLETLLPQRRRQALRRIVTWEKTALRSFIVLTK